MDLLAGVLLVAGSSFALIAGVGLARFPDVFSRIHAATKPATLGLLLVVAGAALRMPSPNGVMKLLLVAVFQVLTAPLAAHLLTRAAYRRGEPLREDTRLDELRRDDEAGGAPARGGRPPEDR